MTNLNEKELESVNGGSHVTDLIVDGSNTLLAAGATAALAVTPGAEGFAPVTGAATVGLAYKTATDLTEVEKDVYHYFHG